MTVKHLYTCLLAGSCFVSCAKKEVAAPVIVPSAAASIPKPGGVFASAGSTATAVLQHSETRGVLTRAFWKDIETTEGQFNFTTLDNQVAAIKAKGKKY
jgi:hypothetical protein